MPNPSNVTYGYGIQESLSSISVQSLGGNHVEIQNSDMQFTEEMAMKVYLLRSEEASEKLTDKSRDMRAAEVAGLGDYTFKNQAERRHVASAWYKRVNPSYNDKVKARNLYDPDNRPDWWPKEVEYCSPTNPKKRGNGKLDCGELKDILQAMKPVLIEMLRYEYNSLMKHQRETDKLSQMSIPQEVRNKASQISTSTERSKARTPKQPVVKQETVFMLAQDTGRAIGQESQSYPVVHQESQANQHDTSLLMPGQLPFGAVSSRAPNQMVVPLPQQPAMDTADLTTIQFNSLYQSDKLSDSPNMLIVKSEAIQHASEVTVYTENPNSPMMANMMPTMVEEINQRLEGSIFSEEQLEALNNCVSDCVNIKNVKPGFDGFSDLLQLRTNNDTVLDSDEPKVKVEYQDKFIENPQMMTSQTQIFDSTTNEIYTNAPSTASCGNDWNIPGYPSEEPSFFMDTGGEDTAQHALNLQLFSSVDQNHSMPEQQTAVFFAESSGFELCLTTDDEAMEVENIASEFPADLYHVDSTEPVSFQDMYNLL